VLDVDLPLSPKQIDFIANSDARLNIATGSVRSGKTISSLLRWLMFVSQAPRGGELAMFAKTRETAARNLFAPLMDPSIFGRFARRVHYTSGAPTAQILGRTVHVLGANDAKAEPKVRGMTLAGGYGDELSLFPESLFKQILARMSVPGAKFYGTSNPDNPRHWLRQQFILRAGQIDLRHWHFTLDDNPGLAPEYVTAIKSEYVGLWYKRFIQGLWVQAEGAVWEQFDEDLHVVGDTPLVTRWPVVGIDYGTVNPFVGLLAGIGVDKRLHIASEFRWDSKIQRRQKTDADYSKDLRQWLGDYTPPGSMHHGVFPEKVVVDPSAASFITQLWNDGWSPIHADNTVGDGIRLVATMLAKDQLRIHRSCEGLIEEISGYSWDDNAALKGEERPIKAADHGPDALRYLCQTTEWDWRYQLVNQDQPENEAA
jgi:PBSX family phage terminase large subunit